MALSVRESNDVNVLLDWLLGGREAIRKRGEASFVDACEAAARLADAANKTLGAGAHGRDVRERWKVKNDAGALRRKRQAARGRAGDKRQ